MKRKTEGGMSGSRERDREAEADEETEHKGRWCLPHFSLAGGTVRAGTASAVVQCPSTAPG